MSIDRLFGTQKQPGNIIWASKVRTSSNRGKGGGKGKNNGEVDRADFWVQIGEGERFWQTGFQNPTDIRATPNSTGNGKISLVQILFDGKVWWDANITTNTNTTRATQFTVYQGDNDNITKDPILTAALGAGRVPEYPGMASVVISANLTNDSNGNFPTVALIVESDIVASPRKIVEDAIIRQGIYTGRPILPGVHVRTTQLPDYATATGPPDTGVGTANEELYGYGFVISQADLSMQDPISQVTTLAHAVQYNGPVQLGSSFNPTLVMAATQETTSTIFQRTESLERLNSDESPPSLIEIEQEPEEAMVTVADIQYQGTKNDYETQSVRVNETHAGLGKTESVTLATAFINPDQPYRIASRVLAEAAASQTKYEYASFCPQITVNSRVTVTPDNPVTQKTLVLRPTKLVYGGNGHVEVISVEAADVGDPAYTQNQDEAPNYTSTPNTQEICPVTIWFEGPRNLGLSPTGKSTIHAILARQAGPEVESNAFTLQGSTDGGSTFNTINTTATQTNADLGSYTLTQLPEPRDSIVEIDTETLLTVVVQDGVTLAPTSVDNLTAFTNNIAFIPGIGLFTYANAVLTAPNTYELSSIIWNIASTQWYEKPQSPAPLAGSIYLLDFAPELVEITPIVNPGDNLQVIAISQESINCGGAVNGDSAYNAYSTVPRPVDNIDHSFTGAGDIVFTWGPGQNQEDVYDPSLFTIRDDPDASDEYRLTFHDGADALVGSAFVTGTTFTYNSATWMAAGFATAQDVNVRIARLSTSGEFLAIDSLFRYNVGDSALQP